MLTNTARRCSWKALFSVGMWPSSYCTRFRPRVVCISSVVNTRLNASSDHSADRTSTTSVILLPSTSMPVLSWVAGRQHYLAAGDWKDCLNEMEKYEAIGFSYQRKSLTSSQTVFMNNIMSTAIHFRNDVTFKEWIDPLVVRTNKWCQAVRTVSSSSGLGKPLSPYLNAW